MKILNTCVVLVSSCLALLAVLGTASGRSGSSVEHPFDELYEEGLKRRKRPQLDRAA